METSLHSKEVSEALRNGELATFVGAGLSIGAGLPSWYQLIGKLAERIGHELPPAIWASGNALIDAAQAYVNERNLNSMVRLLRAELDTTHHQPTSAHTALAQLPFSTVFTANLDNLLERAFQDAGKRVNLVVQDHDIPLMSNNPQEVNVVKMYGDLNQPNTIVLARQQYEQFFLKRPRMVRLLEAELSRSTMLYLGWSHTDPHFNLLFGETLKVFGPLMRSGYAVMFDLPEAQRSELNRKQIEVIQLPATSDRNTELAIWLASLSPVGVEPQSATTKSGAAKTKESTTLRIYPTPNTRTIRLLLMAAFNDEELTAFCMDHFRTVYEGFSAGLGKNIMVQRLLDHCERYGETQRLLELVKSANPYQYNQHIQVDS